VFSRLDVTTSNPLDVTTSNPRERYFHDGTTSRSNPRERYYHRQMAIHASKYYKNPFMAYKSKVSIPVEWLTINAEKEMSRECIK
jgi:hypothetical protein